MTSTKTAGTRERLVAAALTVLESDGPSAIQARTLAAAIGASTMAVYTHFGGMPQLIDAVRNEGFARFAQHVRRVAHTEDPVADLMAQGLACGEFAMRNPQLYRLLFGITDLGQFQKRTTEAGATWDLTEAVDALSLPVSAVERAIAAGRIRAQDPAGAATQILSASHGFVLLAMSGLIDPHGAQEVMASLAINVMVGLGDTRRRAEHSLAAAIEARALHGPSQ